MPRHDHVLAEQRVMRIKRGKIPAFFRADQSFDHGETLPIQVTLNAIPFGALCALL
jgi:hypothetical protein